MRAIVILLSGLAVLASASIATADDLWLARLNQYRAMVKLKPVAENRAPAAGEAAHARYLVENYSAALRQHRPLGVDMHVEDRANHWYSYAGFVAGRASDVLIATGAEASSWAIDEWIAGPFHRFPLLATDLTTVGYGSYCRDGICAAAIDVHSGATSPNHRFIQQMTSGAPITGDSEALGGGWGSRYRTAIEFPPNGSTIELLALSGEWPDPTSSCPGFKQPVGLPITMQFGWNLTPRITGGSLKENGRAIPACAFDAENYRNPDAVTQKLGRRGLQWAGAIVIVPEKPLLPGAKYEVRAVVDDVAYEWSFATAAVAPND